MIIGLVGLMGSGKGTVAKMFTEQGCVEDSFAAPLKDLTSAVFGWERSLMEGDTIESRDFRETPDLYWASKLGIPHFTPRLALQLIGTDVLRKHFDTNIWLHSLESRLKARHSEKCVVISDARFTNELELIKRLGGKVIWVQRGELPEWWSTACEAHENAVAEKIMHTRYRDVHESEWNWAGCSADYIINNNGSKEDLANKVAEIQEIIRLPKLKIV